MVLKDIIGKRVRESRKVAGLSQEELAAKTGVNRTTLASWEICRREPDPKGLLALAVALDDAFFARIARRKIEDMTGISFSDLVSRLEGL